MIIIFGWGKVTRSILCDMMEKHCSHCNTTKTWQACTMRTWFTLFFIPVIPYRTSYRIACPKCESYIQLSREQHGEIKNSLARKTNQSNF